MLTAERLRRKIAATEVAAVPGHITASIGVATGPEEGRDITQLFNTADARLYGAKENGRDRVIGRSQVWLQAEAPVVERADEMRRPA
jgi:diguanylate cyclase (GGDEF)-like protein